MNPSAIDNVVLLTMGELVLVDSGPLLFSLIGKDGPLKPRPEHAEPQELLRSNI